MVNLYFDACNDESDSVVRGCCGDRIVEQEI